MASRVNTKFALMLVLAMGTVAVIAGGLYVVQIRGDAERNARLGDEAMAEGDIPAARTHYGKAVRREPGNRQYLEKYENALLMLVPETMDRARELYQQRLAALQHAAQHFPHDADGHLRLLEELHRGGRLRLGSHYFSQLESAADNMLERVNIADPKHDYGRLYRAIARFQQRNVYGPDDLELTEDDLRVFLESFPESDLGWTTLIMGQWTTAQQLEVEGQTRRSEEKIKEANTTFRQAMEVVPDGLEMSKAKLFRLRLRITDEAQGAELSAERESELRGEMLAAVDHMLDAIELDSPPWSVMEVMSYVHGLVRQGESEHADQTFVDYLKEHETHPLLRLRFAQLLEAWGHYDRAEEHVRTLINADPLPVGLLAQVQFNVVRPAAMSMLVDIEYQRWADAESKEQKQQHIQVMAEARDKLATMLPNQSAGIMVKADGKLEFARGNYVRAAQKFEELLKTDQTPEFLAFAIQCHEELNNVGLAHERTTQALELQPNSVRLMHKKAQLELEMRRYADAEQTTRKALELDPDNAMLARMLALAEARGEDTPVDQDDPVMVARQSARDAWSEGDVETARSILLAQLEVTPDDIRLLDMLARLEFGDGDRERALEYVNRALEIRPDLTALERLKVQLENEDRIDALKALVQSLHSDEGEAAAAMITGLFALQRQQSARADQLEAEGQTEQAADAQELADRAGRELDSYVAKAKELAPDHPALIEHQIRAAVNDQQWDKAEQAIGRARELNLDGANGNLYEARYRIVRGEYEDAVRILLDVTSRMDYSASAWQTLGLAYEELGNFNEASRAYGQAYRYNPTRLDVIRSYVQVLLQTGENIRALDVVRNARNIAPNDSVIRNAWLQLEAEVGDVAVTLRERRKQYETNPDDRDNAVRLAALLGEAEPARSLILDDEGTPRFNEQQWLRLAGPERARVIEQTRNEWQQEADEIVQRLADQSDGEDLQIVALRAQLLRARGQVSAGEQVLRDYIASQDESERNASMYQLLGRYLADASRPQDAVAAFNEGLEYQERGDTSIHVALGDLYFSENEPEQALEQFEIVLENSENPAVRLRTVETLIRLDRLDDAEQRLKDYEQQRGADFTTWMLYAAISERRGELLLEEGKTVEADYQFDQFRSALKSAQQLQPRALLPKIREARQKAQAYRRTGERTQLDAALRTLAEADQIAANDSRVSRMRVEIFREMGDSRSAINELRRVLERNPGDDRSRELLVQLHMQQGNIDSAIEVVQEGITNNESLALWHIRLGDLLLNSKNQPREALRSYMQAMKLRPSPNLVAQIVRTRMVAGLDPSDTVQFVQQYRQFLNEPVVIVAYAQALAAANRPDAIRDVLQRIYATADQRIENGQADPSTMGLWFQIAGQIIPPLSLQDVEALFMELSDGQPRAFDLSSLAYLWRSRVQSASDLNHAIELQKQAVSMIADEEPLVQSPYYYDLGNMLIVAGQHAEAAEAFRKCAEQNPDHSLAMNNYAFLVSEKLDDPQKALPMAERALAISPDNPSVLDTVGWIYYRTGKVEKAEQYLRQSLELRESPSVLLHLAQVLVEKGDLDQALNGPLRRAEELQPDAQTQAEIDRLLADIRTRRAQGQ